MSVYSRALFSGATNGRPLALGTGTTTVHTVGTSITVYNEIYAWVNNVTGSPVTCTLRFGTGTSDGICEALSIPGNSPPIPILTGQNISGGVSLSGYASAANAINIEGYVNVIS